MSPMPATPPHLALLVYFLAYFALAFVWRSWLVYRRSGTHPLVLPSGDGADAYVGRAFKLVVAGCAVVVSCLALLPQAEAWLGPYALLRRPSVAWSGWALLIVALVWLLVAQAQMGASWRIGIDTRAPTPLVQRGLFAVSRNPIFLAMRVNLLGLFLVFPAAATLALLVAGEILMQVQVRLEEEHLRGAHGLSYDEYTRRVRRWL